jgi:uncharacterized protein (TIGR02391 family)
MNLATTLQPRLWEAVRASMEARNFTPAILDGVHLLSDVIRERSGLEGDGVALVGAAFGGSSPKLKVNRLQTESEQNVQRGVEALLRGVYQAIRNPRSHGVQGDEEPDAAAILMFVDYLLRIIDRSRSPFSVSDFIGRLLDPDFVPSERYAELLVNEVPERKRLAVCREAFVRRTEVEPQKLRVFFEVVLGVMSPEDRSELLALVSDELAQTSDEATIRFVLGAFPSDIWPQLSEIARLRIENKLVRSAKEGKWLKGESRCIAGALATWATSIVTQFTLKDELWNALFVKLRSSDRAEQDYVFKYFMPHAQACLATPPPLLVVVVNHGLKAGDVRFKELVEGWQIGDSFLEERPPDDPWRKPFAGALANFQLTPESTEILDEDIPF